MKLKCYLLLCFRTWKVMCRTLYDVWWLWYNFFFIPCAAPFIKLCFGSPNIHHTWPFMPLCLKSGMLNTRCAFSAVCPSPFSTSCDMVWTSSNPELLEVRATELPNGFILVLDLNVSMDRLMERLLFHCRAKRCASFSSWMRSRVSRTTARKSPETSCTSGSFSVRTWRNLPRKKNLV